MLDFKPMAKTFLQLFPVDRCCFSSAGDNLCKKVLITRIGQLLVKCFVLLSKIKGMQQSTVVLLKNFKDSSEINLLIYKNF